MVSNIEGFFGSSASLDRNVAELDVLKPDMVAGEANQVDR